MLIRSNWEWKSSGLRRVKITSFWNQCIINMLSLFCNNLPHIRHHYTKHLLWTHNISLPGKRFRFEKCHQLTHCSSSELAFMILISSTCVIGIAKYFDHDAGSLGWSCHLWIFGRNDLNCLAGILPGNGQVIFPSTFHQKTLDGKYKEPTVVLVLQSEELRGAQDVIQRFAQTLTSNNKPDQPQV